MCSKASLPYRSAPSERFFSLERIGKSPANATVRTGKPSRRLVVKPAPDCRPNHQVLFSVRIQPKRRSRRSALALPAVWAVAQTKIRLPRIDLDGNPPPCDGGVREGVEISRTYNPLPSPSHLGGSPLSAIICGFFAFVIWATPR